MVSNFLAQSAARLGGLVFVTTALAEARFGGGVVAWLRNVPGSTVITLEDPLADVYAAVDMLRPQLPDHSRIKGVVILGNYEEIPSRALQVISKRDLETEKTWNTHAEVDLDSWRVWNDDLYATFRNRKFADVPVSRVPNVPSVWLDGDPWEVAANPGDAYGLRSDDFAFSNSIYADVVAATQQAVMASTPPGAVLPGLGEHELGTDCFYLMLHSLSDPGANYSGASEDGKTTSEAVALHAITARSAIHGTGLVGACWGALIAAQPTAVDDDHAHRIWPRSAADSIAVALVDRGANAIVGFTGQHYVPDNTESPVAFGALLHRYFWENRVVVGLSPAEALYRARVQYVATLAATPLNTLARSIARKTFWSATCLGLGW